MRFPLIRGAALAGTLAIAAAAVAQTPPAAEAPPAPDAAAVVYQPGRWTTQIEIVRIEGLCAPPNAREQMQALLGMFNAMAMCMTAEDLARSDMATNILRTRAGSECTFTRRDAAGPVVAIAADCLRDGQRARVTAHGTNAPTAQDVTVLTEVAPAPGKPGGLIEMRIRAQHVGACKPGDIRASDMPARPGA